MAILESQPPFPAPEELCREFRANGLVQVQLDTDSTTWHQAYIIDLKPTVDRNNEPLYYAATVVLAIHNQQATVTISEKKNFYQIPLDQVRLVLETDWYFDPQISDTVRVLVKNIDNLIMCRVAKVKNIKENSFAVVIADNDNRFTDSSKFDIVSRKDVLPIQSYYTLGNDLNPFFRFALPVSEDLIQWIKKDFKWLQNVELHQKLKRYINLINIYFDSDIGSLICLGYDSRDQGEAAEKAIKQSKMLANIHYNSLKEQYVLTTTYAADKVVAKDFIVTLMIDEDVCGLAIGKKGANIRKVRELPGIKSIDFDQGVFTIIGDSKEICLKAQSMLNFTRERLIFTDPDEIQFFRCQDLVQELVDKSSIVDVMTHSPTDGESLSLLVTGTLVAVDDFKFLLEYQLKSFSEIQFLKEQNRYLFLDLIELNDSGGHYSQELNNYYEDKLAEIYGRQRRFADAVKSGVRNSIK